MRSRTSQPCRVAVACLLAVAFFSPGAMAETIPSPFTSPTPEVPSPFDTPAPPPPPAATATPETTSTPAPAAPVQPQPAPAETVSPIPAPAPAPEAAMPVYVEAPAPVPFAAPRRASGMRTLAIGIALFAAALVPIGIAAGLSPNWEGCAWNEDTYECGHTGAYLASMILFGLGAAVGLGGTILIPIGAVRLSRSRRADAGSRLGSLSPFAAPGRDGGAIFGVSGSLF